MLIITRIKRFVFLVFTVMFFTRCGSNKEQVYQLQKIESIDSFKDNVFFSDITGMLNDKRGFYYFVDSESSLILKTDTSLNLIGRFGKKGLGPLELETPHQIELYRDQLYVNDEYSGKLVTFDKDGKAQGSVRFNFFADFQFSIYKDKIFTYNSALDGGNVHPIAIYDIKSGDFAGSFGQKVETSGELFFGRHNLITEDYLISTLAHNIPIIELYDLNGELLQRADFSTHPILESRVKNLPRFIKREASGAVRTSEVFVCADYSYGYLYLLFTDWSSQEKDTKPNYIFKVLVDSNRIELENVYRLNDGWYESFIIGANNTLITYERQNEIIESYRLPN